LRYAISSGEGMVKVTGEVGTGKTMLCRMLQETLPESVVCAYLANPHLGPEDIVAALLLELGADPGTDKGRLAQQRALQDYLVAQFEARKRVVVLVEEAQCMSTATLEALRLISNLENSRGKLLQVVFFAQPEFNDLLAKPELRPLRDRITHHFELGALDAGDVADYIRFRLYSAGYQGGELFSSAACRRLARASRGLIRRIHVLADKALLAAYAEQARQVEKCHVDRAIEDSGRFQSAKLARLGYTAALAAAIAVAVLAGSQFRTTSPDGWGAPVAVAAPAVSDAQIAALNAIHPAAGPGYVTQRRAATVAWLAGNPERHLTIQVLLTDDDDERTLENLLQSDDMRPLLNDIYLQETHVGGRTRFSVLYGEFSDKTEAYRALAALPDSLQVQKPYLRSLDAIRAASRPEAGQG